MGSSDIKVTALGEGPHWEVIQEGTLITVDDEVVDLDEIQGDQVMHYDFMCVHTGRYKATAILPKNDYLPVFDEEEEPQPERLPIDLSEVVVRVYPWFDCEDPS